MLWIFIQLALRWVEYLHFPPFGMHQGAQSDRACIALNYYKISENFFLPRVMETRGFDGVTGLEFPIIQYIVSLLYQIFGYHIIIYRLIIGVFSFLGFLATLKISGLFIQRELSKYLLSIIWVSSPILEFYGFGFLADIPAMSLSLLGIYHFLNFYFGINKSSNWNYFIIYFTVAGLLKVTFLIYFFGLLTIAILSHFQRIKLEIPIKINRRQILSILLLLIPVISWYSYSNYLTTITWNSHFLQHINPPKSIDDFFSNSLFAINTWGDSVYPKKFMGVILIVAFFSFIKQRKNLEILGYINLIFIAAALVIIILFNGQYRFHDYYLILFFPLLFTLFLFIQQIYLNGQFFFRGFIPIVLLIGFYTAPIFNFVHAKNQLRRTFTVGDYYCQGVFTNLYDFNAVKNWLNLKDPSGQREVIVAFDITPNTALFLFQRQGIRIAPDFDSTLTFSIIRDKLKTEKYVFPYIIINNVIEWKKLNVQGIVLSEKPVFQSGTIEIFEILNSKSLSTNE